MIQFKKIYQPDYIDLKAYRGMSRLDLKVIRDNILLILIALLLILNYGFVQIRLPFDIPLSEAVLLLCFCMIDHKAVLPRFLAKWFSIPLIIWWVFGIMHVLVNFSQYGFWAFRDASNLIESFYIYVGFAFGGSISSLRKFSKWLPSVLTAGILYTFTYPFRESLIAISPTVQGLQGQTNPILFNYVNSASNMLAFIAYQLQSYMQFNKYKHLILALFIMVFPFLFFPSRTLYLEWIILLIYFSLKMNVKKKFIFLGVSCLPILLISLALTLGLHLNSRLGADLSIQDYWQILLEMIPGYTADTNLTSGTEQRLMWWTQLLSDWSQSWFTMVFGMGYGFPLIDFHITGDIVVREPHNDFLSVLARGGIISLLAFLVFQCAIISTALKTVNVFKKHSDFGPFVTSLFFILLCTWVYSLGEPPFTISFFAIPYYFSAGILLRMYSLRNILS